MLLGVYKCCASLSNHHCNINPISFNNTLRNKVHIPHCLHEPGRHV